jgi:hypothetical protein
MNLLFNFIEQQCTKYNIDKSHGSKHAWGTALTAKKLLKTLDNVTEQEERVAIYSAALHDMCDSKYCPIEEATHEIKTFLLDLQWDPEEIEAVISIITTMSYSKLKRSIKDGIIQYPSHGKWQRAYHVARNADLLEGYIVARCVLYNRHIYPLKTDDEHWERATQLFNERVFTYVSEGWVNLPGALKMVPTLEQEARRCLLGRLMDWPEPLL